MAMLCALTIIKMSLTPQRKSSQQSHKNIMYYLLNVNRNTVEEEKKELNCQLPIANKQ